MLDGSKAMGPVTIGDRAIVAANTLVLSDVPAEAVAVGQPARVAKMRSDRARRRDRVAEARSELAEAETARRMIGLVGRVAGRAVAGEYSSPGCSAP